MLTHKALKYFVWTINTKWFFKCEITINVLLCSSRFIWKPTLWVYSHYLVNIFLWHCAVLLWTSGSDIYRHQILTSKVDPHTVRDKVLTLSTFSAAVFASIFRFCMHIFKLELLIQFAASIDKIFLSILRSTKLNYLINNQPFLNLHRSEKFIMTYNLIINFDI